MVAGGGSFIGPQLPPGLAPRVEDAEAEVVVVAGDSHVGHSGAQPGVLRLPPRWKVAQGPGAGLTNLGNTCYFNSTLQCLAYLPPLAHYCLTSSHSSACPRAAGTLRPGAPPCAFCLLEKQIRVQLRSGRGASVSPGEVVRQLHLFSRSFVGGRQEDSHELLTCALDVLEKDARRAAMAAGASKGCRTVVEDLFQGRWQSQVRCLSCGHESNTYESFVTLPLDLGRAGTVLDALRSFVEVERLDGNNKYKCDRCKRLVPAEKQTTIHDDPNILVVHLKRFDAACLGGKVNRHIRFSEVLDLSPHMTPPPRPAYGGAGGSDSGSHHPGHRHPHPHHVGNGNGNGAAANGGDGHHHHHSGQHHGSSHHHGGGSNGAAPGPGPGSSGGGGSRYHLTGVLVHQGMSVHSGHYYSFIRDSQGRWHCMNDSHVSPAPVETVLSQNAYLLFYVRQAMKAPQPLQQQQQPANGAAAAAAAPVPRALAADTGAAPGQGHGHGPNAHAENGSGAAPRVYGPMVPPQLRRRQSADGDGAAAAAPATADPHLPATANGAARATYGSGANGLPARVQVSAGAGRGAATVRLAAKITPLQGAAAAAAGGGAAASAATAAPGHSGPLPSANGRAMGTPRGATADGLAVHDADDAAQPHGLTHSVGTPAATAKGAARTAQEQRPPAAAVTASAAINFATATAELEAAPELEPAEAVAELGPGISICRKRRREDADGDVRQLVEEELVGRTSSACFLEGIKRLKTNLLRRLNVSDWKPQLLELVKALQAKGLSMEEARAQLRVQMSASVPQPLKRYGVEQLRLLLGTLSAFGWLGGVMPLL